MPRRAARRSLAALAVLLLAAGGAEASARLARCAPASVLRPAGPPPNADDPVEPLAAVPANDVHCKRGVALRVDARTTLWRCQAIPDGDDDLPEGNPEYAFLLERAGEPLRVLPDSLMAGRLRSFDLFRVDLDGDGTEERVLAAWNGQGNGLGVNRWTIRVFDAGWRLLRQFDDVSDWGDSNLVRRPGRARGCDIAITGFVDSRDSRGREGISFQARFFRLIGGEMREAPDRPAVERRYTFGFQRQRTAHFNRSPGAEKGDVAAWLSHRATVVSPSRPAPRAP